MASQIAKVRSTFAVRRAKGSKLGRVDAVDLLSCYAKLQPKRVATRFTRERRLREGREAEVVRAGVEKTPKLVQTEVQAIPRCGVYPWAPKEA
jgi:hypothetical protein